ncbi:hypothetical protein [Microbacterium elymi]|uniref:Uncharacterized protein n=1 Tax=Microbacterium elymi TaxID=2909587 RepID=A0ABY5NLD5_9MICO|nr:hypothetical protein [Microbacterium elymi]UUT35988.1 hypothetical protein L2X98_23035 [Microbacterium elymi]
MDDQTEKNGPGEPVDARRGGASWEQREEAIKPLGVVLQPPAEPGPSRVFPTVYIPDRLLVSGRRDVNEVVRDLNAAFVSAGWQFEPQPVVTIERRASRPGREGPRATSVTRVQVLAQGQRPGRFRTRGLCWMLPHGRA